MFPPAELPDVTCVTPGHRQHRRRRQRGSEEVLVAQVVRTVDYHTGGEPFRIVADPPVAHPGVTVADRRVRAIGDPDGRKGCGELLCFEPRGHADMYGGFLVPPDDDGADLGVLFWHKDGFSTACGHGTIALGVWAVDTGLVRRPPRTAASTWYRRPLRAGHRPGAPGPRPTVAGRFRQRAQLVRRPGVAGEHLPG